MSETYTNLLQWLVVAAFFLLVGGATVAEAFWISKQGWASFGKSLAFAALSNFIGFAVGLFIFFVIMGIFLMFTLDGTTQHIFDSSTGGAAAIIILIFGVVVTPLLLIICKRIFLSILKIQSGNSAWLYALASSVMIFVISLGVPILLGYFIFR